MSVSNKNYGYIGLVTVGLGFHCFVTSFRVRKARYSCLTTEYLETQYPEENAKHIKEFGCPISKGAHPDNGLGRLSDKLDFISWVKLQNAQRAHGNYLETITFATGSLLVGGLYFPRFCATVGAIHIVGRELYASGYVNGGAKGRTTGFLIVMSSLMTLLGAAVTGSIKHTGLLKN